MPSLKSQKVTRPAFYVLHLAGFQQAVSAIYCQFDAFERGYLDVEEDLCCAVNYLCLSRDISDALSTAAVVRRYQSAGDMPYYLSGEGEIESKISDLINVKVSEIYRSLVGFGFYEGQSFPYVVEDIRGNSLYLVRKDLFLKKLNEDTDYGYGN